jgi:hypothetical protein
MVKQSGEQKRLRGDFGLSIYDIKRLPNGPEAGAPKRRFWDRKTAHEKKG